MPELATVLLNSELAKTKFKYCYKKVSTCNIEEVQFDSCKSSMIYKITKIVRAFWLVKNLWFIVPVNS